MKFYCRAIVLVTFILLSDSVYAINKCIDNNGKTSYQNKPCKTGQISRTISIKENKNTGLPGNSIATVSPYLYNDITKNLKGWVKRELACDSYKVLDTKSISVEGDIIMGGKGRLFSGIISEKWFISYCGTQTTLGIVFQPDGKGGNYVVIATFKEQVHQPEHSIQHAFDGRKWILGYKKKIKQLQYQNLYLKEKLSRIGANYLQ